MCVLFSYKILAHHSVSSVGLLTAVSPKESLTVDNTGEVMSGEVVLWL